MKKGQKISVTLKIIDKDKESESYNEVISEIINRKGKIIGPANNNNSAYYILFNGSTKNEAISTKFITKI